VRVPRLHVDASSEDGVGLAPGARLTLAEDRAHYLSRVLRRNRGDALWVFDGRGTRIDATVAEVRKRDVLLQLGSEVVHTPAPVHPVTLAMALLKGDAFDDVLRRATELGVDAILPLLAEHGEGKLPDDPERALRRQDHWRSIAVSACEQCGRDWVPTVLPARTALSWLGAAAGQDMGLTLLLEPTAVQDMADLVGRVDGPVTLAIGPEGGWSGPERRRAREHGVTEVALGTPVLRAETAPVAALAMLSLLRQVRLSLS
jgi:16S rRNA (uracil1498-N3)-methyltransferase